MSTAGLFPWLQLERQTKTPGVGTPAQDLVKSLIGIQERRELRDRLKRQEERQARLDQIEEEKRQRDQEWEDFERRQAIAAQTSGLEKATQETLSNIVPVALGTAEQPAPPPAEREKVTTKTGPDGSQTVSVDRPLAETPVDPKNQLPEDLINLNLGPELDLGIGAETPGAPEILPLQERMTQEILKRKAPMTATYQGQEVELPYREEVLQQLAEKSRMSPQVMSALIRASRPTSQASSIQVVDRGGSKVGVDKDTGEVLWEIDKTLAPKAAEKASQDRQYVWNIEEGQAEWVPTEQLYAAPPGKYRKAYVSDVKGAANKRLGSVMTVFGGPGDPDPTTFWNAALAMNRGNEAGWLGLGRVKEGIGTQIDVVSGKAPITKAYQDQLAGFASMIAKEFGEAGRLSDQDIQRTINLFPTAFDTEMETKLKLNQINKVLQYASGNAPKPTDPDFSDWDLNNQPEMLEPMESDEEIPPPPPGNWEDAGGE